MAESSQRIESVESLSPYERWQSEVTASEKELDKWRKRGRRIVKEFRAQPVEVSGMYLDQQFERRFNLFTANTQIMQSALLNQVPQPFAEREFRDQMDDVARVAARIMERALTHQAKKNTNLYDILCNVVQDNLVPGVGLSWHTYHAEIEEREEPAEEAGGPPLKYEEVVGEELIDEYVYWEDIVWSPARCWEEVRWLARKVYMTRDQLNKRFGKEVGSKIALDYAPKKNEAAIETKNQVFQQACIYEIWDKESKKIIWWTKGYDKILDEKEDFLELDGFFPCPKPFFSTLSNGQVIPIPDYEYARDQYRELNEINTRISLLIRACRVVGVYDKTAGQVTSVLSNAAENTLVPVDQWAAFAEKGGLKGVIDWVPLDQVVVTIDQLMKGREDVKAQIYEVTGMSDIIRGASKASETLGAQKIKAQYASMRIQTRQKNMAIYASQVFSIQDQLIRKHMDHAEISRMAQVDFMGEDPQLVQQALQLLKSPDFTLRVQVESDTLSDVDFKAEQQGRMEYMQSIAQFLKEAQPYMGDQVLGPMMMQLLQFSLSTFKVGKKFEGTLDKALAQMQQRLANPPPPQPNPEQQKMQAEMQMAQQEHQLNMQGRQQELQFKAQEHQMDNAQKQREMQFKAIEANQKSQLEQRKMQQDFMIQEAKSKIDLDSAAQQAMMKPPGAVQ
jgi:hypothetical protein